MKLKPLPRSRAKTCWGLLKAVKHAILSEPKRADMGCFRSALSPTAGGPACGTVGCFAGWINILSGTKPYYLHDDTCARRLLGEDCDFSFRNKGGFFDYFNEGSGDTCEFTSPNTKEHAKAVAARIDRFMAQNEGVLKARSMKTAREAVLSA